MIYSIIEGCRRHGDEPYSYLCDVLTRLPSMTNRQIKDIVVPKTWAAGPMVAKGIPYRTKPDGSDRD